METITDETRSTTIILGSQGTSSLQRSTIPFLLEYGPLSFCTIDWTQESCQQLISSRSRHLFQRTPLVVIATINP